MASARQLFSSLLAQALIGERKQHHAGIADNLLDDALEMLLGAHHRPEMADRLDILELRDRRLADMFQRLAGGVGQQMQVQPVHGAILWAKR